jgi:DnaJ-class molecular chaperone
MKDHYELLGVARSATRDEIVKAYRAEVARYHPDRHADNKLRELARERLEQLREAYETLKDRERRRTYDAWLSSGRRGTPSPPGGAQGHTRRAGPSFARIAGVALALLAVPLLVRLATQSRFAAVFLAGLGIVWALSRLWRWARSRRR